MAEQRTNALGQTVEFNEDSGRWDKIVDGDANTAPEGVSEGQGIDTEQAGTGDPAPGNDETMVDEGAAPQRRTRFGV